MPIRAKPNEPEKLNPYLPTPNPPLIFENFTGIDTYTTRPGVEEDKAWWLDGFMPIGKRYLRTLYGVSTTIQFDDEAPISFFGFANIGSTPYSIIIHLDGSVHAVNTTTLASTELAPTGTIQNPSRLSTGLCQYGDEFVIIVSQQTNGYFIWDGTTFYEPGDSFGGGTIPTAIGGTAVETYQGRVWIANGPDITFSAPGSLINFTTSGGGTITSTDSFLRVRYIALVQTNGFLYLVGDSSISYISGVQTSGSPAVTTFTLLNADPEVGSPWPSAVTTFGRGVVMANAFGVHVNYGAAVTKISDPLNGVYNTVPNFAGFVPSAAKAILFGIKVWMLLLPIIDPYTGEQVNKLMIWDGQDWFASSQDVDLVYIQHQEIDSVLTAWGTDGTSLYQLFQSPSSNFEKIAQSKLWDQPVGYQMVKAVNRLYGMCQFYSLESPTIDVSIDNESGGTTDSIEVGPREVVFINDSDQVVPVINNMSEGVFVFSSSDEIVIIGATRVSQNGHLVGITATTMASDMAIISLMIQPVVATGPG